MAEENPLPLSNTPEHLNWLADQPVRERRTLLRVDGSSKIFDVQELHAGSMPEMFKGEWEPRLHENAMVSKTEDQLRAEAAEAAAKEYERQLRLAAEKDRKVMKVLFLCGGAALGLCALVVLVLVLRGKPAGNPEPAAAAEPSVQVEPK